MIKEKPILFSAEMVQAILDGKKTQTRRALRVYPVKGGKPSINPHDDPVYAVWDDVPVACSCPYGKIGDRLWVRETWTMNWHPYHGKSEIPKFQPKDLPIEGIHYRATETPHTSR